MRMPLSLILEYVSFFSSPSEPVRGIPFSKFYHLRADKSCMNKPTLKTAPLSTTYKYLGNTQTPLILIWTSIAHRINALKCKIGALQDLWVKVRPHGKSPRKVHAGIAVRMDGPNGVSLQALEKVETPPANLV